MDSLISYAGLDTAVLWAKAKRIFAQQEGTPERFRMFVPLFPIELVVDMPYTSGGFACDSDSYHRVLAQRMPSLYKGDNYLRCFDKDGQLRKGAVVTVDQAWTAQFPQYQPFAGEKLMVHMIGGGHQAAAVPESIFPRGGAMLANAEQALHITARCSHFSAWLKQQLEAGSAYDADGLERQYLALYDVMPVRITQKELGRVLQEMSIIRDLHASSPAPAPAEMYTQPSKLSEGIPQYVPFRCACDCFEPSPVTRATARLLQLYFEGDNAPGDFWLPYADASEYIDKRRMTLDVRALCEGFQIAPACDADTRGGVYPDRVRVVVVRDRSLPMLTAETLNNPAYGSGMNPLGVINRLVYLPRSAQLLEKGQLSEEAHSVTAKNTRVDEGDYLHMRALAEWQEHKGRLIDAMYRRESALAQMPAGARAYDRAKEMLDAKVERLAQMVADEPALHGQRSSYDADIDYLRLKAQARQGAVPGFVPDAQREACIESGYAMRSQLRSYALTDLTDTTDKTPQAKPARPSRMQAPNGQWFEQMSMFGDT